MVEVYIGKSENTDDGEEEWNSEKHAFVHKVFSTLNMMRDSLPAVHEMRLVDCARDVWSESSRLKMLLEVWTLSNCKTSLMTGFWLECMNPVLVSSANTV